jgi:hypothetical protein
LPYATRASRILVPTKEDVRGKAMSPDLDILALQNAQQQSGGGLGLSIEIIGATVLACALLTATVMLLSKYRRRKDAMILRERQARLQMQELCPDGWAARIILYGDGAPLPDDAPGGRNVCVEWTEYEADASGHTEVAVARRMWARTIAGALRGMLADRQLDVELEKIERRVLEDTPGGGGETGPQAAGPQAGPSR